MSRVGDGLSRLFGRVEILARGAEPFLRAAEIALDKGDALDARAQARALLARVPKSPLGLALWADAAEACGFPEEVVEALEQLVEQAPWNQEIWLRLGRAGLTCGWDGARDALERAAEGRDTPSVTREALLTLADLDMEDEPVRASHWLARVPSHLAFEDAPLALREAECAMARGMWDEAKTWLPKAEALDETQRGQGELGGRLRLVQARAAKRWPEEWVGRDPLRLAISAYVLGAPSADRLLVQLIGETDDAALLALARDAVTQLGELGEPRYQAAFALAEGRRDDARGALLEAARGGDREAAASLASLAVGWRDVVAVGAIYEQERSLLPDDVALVWEAELAARDDRDADALALLERAWQHGGEGMAWAEDAMARLLAQWLPTSEEPSAWDRVWGELRRLASLVGKHDLNPAIDALAVERDRPLYVAILGEFNAGKSTLINALLSTDVAPTGIRPTTATLHWVAWAPDPFARVVIRDSADRVVMHDDLKSTLDEIRSEGGAVDRVFIYAPVERLKRIEILDTPGFNAPDTTHAEEARRGIEEAHVALWLLDATAPLKDSERQVIERVAEAGVPVQVLVNKRDRLAPADLEQVMTYVQRSLDQIGITSLRPPVAMSAQLALRGRLGDADALKSSGWEDVEALLAEHVVNVADELRERALRRKTARIARQLEGAVEERAESDRRRERERVARHEQQRQLATLLRSEQQELAEAVLAAVEPTLQQLVQDMRPLEQLADERRSDPEVRAYVVERTSERLTAAFSGALSDALDERSSDGRLHGSTVQGAVRGVFAGAAAAYRGSPPIDGVALQATLAVAIASTADALEAEEGSTDRTRRHLGASLRIRALTEVLVGNVPQNVAAPTSK
jgi:small GTP-binding protein